MSAVCTIGIVGGGEGHTGLFRDGQQTGRETGRNLRRTERGRLELRGGSGDTAKSGKGLVDRAETMYKTAVAETAEPEPSIWSCLFAAVAYVMGGTSQDRVIHRDEKLEDAGELFAQASNKFKLERKWKAAGDALVRAGDCYQRHSTMSCEAANQFADAAKILKKDHPEEAVAALKRAAAVLDHSSDPNMQRAARVHRDLAELYELRGDFKAAAAAMERAAELFMVDGATLTADSLEVRLADLVVLGGAFADAARRYEELGQRALNSELKSCGGRDTQDLWLRAGLCWLADGSLSELDQAMERCEEADLTFAGSQSAARVKRIQEALVAADKDRFGQEVRELGDTLQGDKVGVKLLSKIKEVVGREGEAGHKVSHAMAKEDEEDLL